MTGLHVHSPDPGDSGDDAPQTVAAVIALFLSHGKKPHASERAWAETERELRRFERAPAPLSAGLTMGALHFDRARRGHADRKHLRLWVDSIAAYQSDWTKKRVIATIQRAFNWAVSVDLLERNPFKGIAQPAGPRRRPLEEAEFLKMVRASDPCFRRVLTFLKYTGARPGEMSVARWGDVQIDLDRQQGWISLAQHKTRHATQRPRLIALHPVVVKLLLWMRREMLVEPGLEDPIFVNWRGNAWTRSALALRMGRLRKKAGVPRDAALYGLRHAYATNGLANGVELKTMSELLGHSTTKMTEHYLHLAKLRQHLLDAARRAVAPRRGPEQG